MIALYRQTITAFTIAAILNGSTSIFLIEKSEHSWIHSFTDGSRLDNKKSRKQEKLSVY